MMRALRSPLMRPERPPAPGMCLSLFSGLRSSCGDGVAKEPRPLYPVIDLAGDQKTDDILGVLNRRVINTTAPYLTT
jgi:hypothetical protein